MFSSWRQTVESLAQPPRNSQDASSNANGEEAPVRSSIDGIRSSISSSSHLAESALSNLRKSLAAQRPASPSTGQAQSPALSSPASPAPKLRPSGRSTLEDRLRAKLASGETSNSSTPTASSRTSPSPVPTTDHPLAIIPSASQDQDTPVVKGPPNPLSPTSAPLPDSPLQSPTFEGTQPVHSSVTASLPPSSNSHTLSVEPTEDIDSAPPINASALATSASEPESALSPEDDTVTVEAASAPHIEVNGTEADPTESLNSAKSASQDLPAGEAEITTTASPSAISLSDAPTTEEASPVNFAPIQALAAEPLNTADGDVATDGPESIVYDIKPPNPATPTEEVLETGSVQPQSASPNGKIFDSFDVEALQKRLKLVEQRFADVSTSFKRLQAEKLAADRVLRELTSVESVTEVDALRDFLQNLSFKTEMAQDEIRRLTGKLTRQEERIEELRDIHRLESKSQIDQIDRLKAQIEEAEKLLNASQSSTAKAEDDAVNRKAEMEKLQSELDKAKTDAKEEEEKRTKAITLLKTVRQKLVKAEKERDDAIKEVTTLKEAEKAEREREKTERARLQAEIQKANDEREMAVQGLRVQFEREMAASREKQEKELATLRGQYELEAITAKTNHVREIENRKLRIADLESTVRTLSSEKDELFDQVQLRQAELESSQSLLESLQGQNTELQFQLREANDRVALLQEEFSDIRHEQDMKVASSGPSASDITRLLAAAESKYETKLSDLSKRLAEAERERDEGEARWSKTLTERAREVDLLKAQIDSSRQSKDKEDQDAQALEKEIQVFKTEIRSYQTQITDLQTQLQKAAEDQEMAQNHIAELNGKTASLQLFVDEGKSREAQLRSQNKTLREELRKVQSSVVLLERQRGPGVGYWALRNESTSELRSPTSSISELPLRDSQERASTPSAQSSDEELNLEYLRNIILQFLEHKEMRPHLVRILSTILRFTPQETRRLIAKV